MRRDRDLGSSISKDNFKIVRDSSLLTIGSSTFTTLTNSGYSRVTGRIWTIIPMMVKYLIVQLGANGTYSFDFLSTATGTTSIFSLTSGYVASGGAATYNIYPDKGDFFMPSGAYNFSISSTTTTKRRYNSAFVVVNDYFIAYQESWAGAALSNDSMPVQFVGYPVRTSGLTTLSHMKP